MLNSRPLDILYAGTLPPHPGGSAISASLIIVGLAEAGHTLRAVAPMTAEVSHDGDEFARGHPEISVTRYPAPYFEVAPNLPSPESYRENEREHLLSILPALIEKQRPDVVIAGRETFAHVSPDIAGRYSIPCVLRIAGGGISGILNRTLPDNEIQTLLQQFRKVSLMVAPANHLKESLAKLGFNNVKVIPNAVDLRQFSPGSKDHALLGQLGIKRDDIVIAHLSNLKALKRSTDVALSAEQALRHNEKLFYVIVGDGPLRMSMEDICRKKGISGRFAFVGWVDYARVADYINLADMVVMASESEGQARVYLETQACGRLLLASDIPAAREVITHGETGLLYRMGDIDDLTAKTLLAAGDPHLCKEIGRRARQRVAAHRLEDAVAAYAEMFREVVEVNRQG